MTSPYADKMTTATKCSVAYRAGIEDQRALNAGKAIRPRGYTDPEAIESYNFGRKHVGRVKKTDR